MRTGKPVDEVLLYDALVRFFDGALELIWGVLGSLGVINCATFDGALKAIGSDDALKPFGAGAGAGALGSPAVNV